MPDLLGATNPVPGYDKSLNNNRMPQTAPENPHIQNAPDLSKVNRADRRTDRQDSNLQGDGPIRYDSNFQAFLQRLRAAPSMSESLSRLFAGERTVVLSGMSEGVAAEMSKAFELLEMDEGQLLEFLKGQMRAGTRFGGALFALLRGAYARASSDAVQTDILKFLKSYADFSSTAHIEGNLLRELRGMADTMPASWGAKLYELLAQLENGIAAGDRQGNLALLQKGAIPYMSEYVERTHDMGTPRELLTMLTLNVARYQNGSVENLLELFHQLGGYGTLKGQLEGIDDQSLLTLLKDGAGRDARAVQFADHLSAAAAAALRGEGSADVQQIFRNLVSAMLVNESVYMPINHYLLPLEWNGRMLFSELWVDPDAENDRGDGSGRKDRGMKLLFKIDVQSLGFFDVILTTRGSEVEVQVGCPARALPFAQRIEQSLTDIVRRNDLTPAKVTVRRMDKPVTLTEVFPKIFEKRSGVNVRA